MIRRALITLIPAFAALTLLFGAPAQSATGPGATSAEWNAGAVKAPATKRVFHEEAEVGSLNAWAADHGEPDRTVRASSIMTWPPLVVRNALPTVHSVLRTHSACATPPRGPPTT